MVRTLRIFCHAPAAPLSCGIDCDDRLTQAVAQRTVAMENPRIGTLPGQRIAPFVIGYWLFVIALGYWLLAIGGGRNQSMPKITSTVSAGVSGERMVELVRQRTDARGAGRGVRAVGAVRFGTGCGRPTATTAGAPDGLTTEERTELRRLRRENRDAPRGAGDPEKSRGLVRAGDRTRSRRRIRVREGAPGRPSDRHHVPRAGRLRQRVLRVAHAPRRRRAAQTDAAAAASRSARSTAHSRGTYGAPRDPSRAARRRASASAASGSRG